MEKFSIISALLNDINLLFNERDFLSLKAYSLNCDSDCDNDCDCDCNSDCNSDYNCNCDCGDNCGYDGTSNDCY